MCVLERLHLHTRSTQSFYRSHKSALFLLTLSHTQEIITFPRFLSNKYKICIYFMQSYCIYTYYNSCT